MIGHVSAPANVETNLVFFDVSATNLTVAEVARRLLERGIRIGVESEFRMRAVTHFDADRAGVAEAAEALASVAYDAATR